MKRSKAVSGGRPPIFSRLILPLLAGILFFSLLLTASATDAVGEDTFEIVVPIETVVRAPEGSVTVLDTHTVPSGLVGETCSVTAQSHNQSSVHPGNDLIVESQTRIVLTDVEAERGGTVVATDTMVIDDQVLISLVMGSDEVFSAGIDVLFDCPPEPTTTTSPEISTTTTAGESTTTTADLTTTTSSATTTTTVDVTTTTSSGSTTTTTVPGESTTTTELVRTGPPDARLGFVAIAMTAFGVLLLVGERSAVFSGVGALTVYRRGCQQCDRDAEFMTPHGRLCRPHTRMALDGDDELWMPSKLTRRSSH